MIFKSIKNIPLILLFTLLCSQGHACHLTMQAGPYLTPDFVREIFLDFITAVEKDTNCEIDIRLSSTLEEYLKSILNRKWDIFIFGQHSLAAFSKRGFIPTLETKQILRSLVVVNPNRVALNSHSKIYTSRVLAGKTIITPSQYSLTAMHFNQYIQDQDLMGKVTIKTSENYTVNTLDFIKGDIDAFVVLNFVYKTLPDYVHHKFKVIAQSELQSVVMYSHPNLKTHIIESMKKHSHIFPSGDWIVYKGFKENIYSIKFEQLLKKLEIEP